MWQNVDNWCKLYYISLYNHLNFSVTVKFVKIKKIGLERWNRQALKVCLSTVWSRVFVTGSGGGRVRVLSRTMDPSSPCLFSNSVLSLCFSPEWWNLLRYVWSFFSGLKLRYWSLLKENWFVHWQNKWGNIELQIECSAVRLTSRNAASVF